MDWSEILTQGEAEYMQRVLPQLRSSAWAAPLLAAIQKGGGITYANKPLLFEARVGHALEQSAVQNLQYEVSADVGGSTVDFQFGMDPVWLVEVVSIGRSRAAETATVRSGVFYGTLLASPSSLRSAEENQQSEEGEALLVIQKIGEKLHDGSQPTKFPLPTGERVHAVIVDMRGHLGGGDIADWMQIAYGAVAVAPEFRKYWVATDGKRIPILGIWHPENRMRFAATARARLHAICFVAEQHYEDGALTQNSWMCFNPHLIHSEDEARGVRAKFPLALRLRSQAS